MLMFAFVLLFLGQQVGELQVSSGPFTRDGSLFRYEGDVDGNVVAVYQDIRVEADWITYDESTEILRAGERVLFFRGEEHLEASAVEINVVTKTGSFTNASGQLGPGFYVVAGTVKRLEDGTYELYDAVITTCEGPNAGWTFSAGQALIDPEQRVVARNTIFKFEGVPVFYLPYMVAPTADRARSSGFLIPSTSTSTTKGRSIRQAFYWAINRSADATFTGEYFSKRGPTGTVEFRAVPNGTSSIQLRTFFAKDRKDQGGQSVRILTQAEFPGGFRGVADMNVVSSFEFRQVYEEGVDLISSPIEHSLGFLTNNGPRSSINLLFNRSAIFFQDQPSVALRKFPTLEFALPANSISQRIPVYFTMEGGFTGLARRDARITTPSFNQRFDVRPLLEIPVLRSGAFEWSHRLGARETFYTHSLQPAVTQDEVNRLSFDYTMRFSGPNIERNFGTWRHVIEPSVEYRYVTGADRFREIIVVDEVDLLTDTNEIEYAITNRFFAGHEFLSWRIAQKMYFDPDLGDAVIPGTRNVLAPLLDLTGFAFAEQERRFSPLVSTVRISTTPQTSTDLQVDYDTQRHEFRSAGVIGGLNRGHVFSNVAYFFTKRSEIQLPHHQIRGLIGYGNEQKLGMSAALGFSYDIHRSLFQGSTAQLGYNTDCYGLSFEFSQYDIGARKESSIKFALSLRNIGSFGTIRRQERLF